MTTPRTAQSYGAPKENLVAPATPTGVVTAQEYCRVASDVGQMTNTSIRAWVQFPTANSNGTISTGIVGQSHMGVGSAALPTVARTGTGVYTITYPASWQDDSGILTAAGPQPGKTEAIAFLDASGDVMSGTVVGVVFCTVNGRVITAYVRDPLSAWALSDLTVGTVIRVEGR